MNQEECIINILHFSDVLVKSSPVEVQRADACTTSVKYQHMQASQAVRSSGVFLGGRLDGISGTIGFPLKRRVSVMLTTMLIAAVDVNQTLLQHLLGRWASDLAFPRGLFASLSVSSIATAADRTR